MKISKILFTPLYGHPTIADRLYVLLAVLLLLLSLVPNPGMPYAIRQSSSTRALSDVNSIEAGLVEILADTQRKHLGQLFEPARVRNVAMRHLGATSWPPITAKDFEAATTLYTRTLYAILRSGRSALDARDPVLECRYGDVFQTDVADKLGNTYFDVGSDSYGNLYNIYPGPWDARAKDGSLLTIPFRVYMATKLERALPGTPSSLEPDALSILMDPHNSPPNDYSVGYPAPTDEVAYIWSNGANLMSGQALYSAAGYEKTQTYDFSQGIEYVGGGDDINNWDPGSSWRQLY